MKNYQISSQKIFFIILLSQRDNLQPTESYFQKDYAGDELLQRTKNHFSNALEIREKQSFKVKKFNPAFRIFFQQMKLGFNKKEQINSQSYRTIFLQSFVMVFYLLFSKRFKSLYYKILYSYPFLGIIIQTQCYKIVISQIFSRKQIYNCFKKNFYIYLKLQETQLILIIIPIKMYFKLTCFQAETTKRILIVSNVIVAVLGVVHWGYCGVLSQFLRLYYNYTQRSGIVALLTAYEQYKKMIDSPMAYYAITGIQQIVTSVLVILVLLQILGTTKRNIWVRILAGLLIFNFAFNFVIAISSAMTATYWNQLFKQQLDQINNFAGGGILDDWILALVRMVRFITVEAVLTFVLSLPLIMLTTIALVEYSFKEEFQIETQLSQGIGTIEGIKVKPSAQ